MANHIIAQIDNFTTFKYDKKRKRVVNLKRDREREVDEFLDIQYILDCNRVKYHFEKNFEIQILG